MNDAWREIDREVLGCLMALGPMAPHELARELGISEGEATMFLAALAREGKVRIRLVEAAEPLAAVPARHREAAGLSPAA